MWSNAHRTVLREVLYRHHPWFGRRVCVYGAVDKGGFVVFRCTLDGSQADRWLEVPPLMFDRTACPDPRLLAAQPYVSIEALAALSTLLDLALKDQTPSAVLLSGASGASHDQNRERLMSRETAMPRSRYRLNRRSRPQHQPDLFAARQTAPSARPHGWSCRRKRGRPSRA